MPPLWSGVIYVSYFKCLDWVRQIVYFFLLLEKCQNGINSIWVLTVVHMLILIVCQNSLHCWRMYRLKLVHPKCSVFCWNLSNILNIFARYRQDYVIKYVHSLFLIWLLLCLGSSIILYEQSKSFIFISLLTKCTVYSLLTRLRIMSCTSNHTCLVNIAFSI